MRAKQERAFRELLELGADPNLREGSGRTIVHWAASEADPVWLRAALEFGGDPNVEIAGGETPLFSAISSFEVGHLDLLIEAGAEISTTGTLRVRRRC
jgi:ankyrin repeat protein